MSADSPVQMLMWCVIICLLGRSPAQAPQAVLLATVPAAVPSDTALLSSLAPSPSAELGTSLAPSELGPQPGTLDLAPTPMTATRLQLSQALTPSQATAPSPSSAELTTAQSPAAAPPSYAPSGAAGMAPAQLGLPPFVAAPPHGLSAGTLASHPPREQVAVLQPVAAPGPAPVRLQANLAPTSQLPGPGPAASLAPQQASNPLAGKAPASAEQLPAAALAPGRLPAAPRPAVTGASAQLQQLAPLPAPRLQPLPAAAGPQRSRAHLESSGPAELAAPGTGEPVPPVATAPTPAPLAPLIISGFQASPAQPAALPSPAVTGQDTGFGGRV